MKIVLIGLSLFVLVLGMEGFSLAGPKIKGMTMEYNAQGMVMKGYLAYDENIKGKRPGILVVHEWWGLNDYARSRAKMLAELGYIAFAVDMYGEGKQAMNPDDARKLDAELMKNFDVAKARFTAALDLLKQEPTVDPTRIAAIGYCMGGEIVLNMAREGIDLKGVASFHGGLAAIKPAQPGTIKAKILVFHGANDKIIPPEQIELFKKEMKSAGTDFTFISYPGAMHSFTNPEADALGKKFNLPIGYNAQADKQSWDELKKFLKMVFKD